MSDTPTDAATSTPASANTGDAVSVKDPVKKLVTRHDHYYDTRTWSYKSRKTCKPKTSTQKRVAKKAVDVRRYIDSKGRHYHTTYVILSELLRGVLIDIHQELEDLDLTGAEVELSKEILYFSYVPLLHRLKEEEAKEIQDEVACQHIKAAIAVTNEDLGQVILNVNRLTGEGRITFDLLWTLFPANKLIFSHNTMVGEDCLYRVTKTKRVRDNNTGKEFFVITCRTVRNDGERFGLAKVQVQIEEFDGVAAICDLSAYPLDLHQTKDDIYAKAIDRGKKISGMEAHVFQEYIGHAIRGRRDGNVEKHYNAARVMISPSAFDRYEPNSSYNPAVFKPLKIADLTDDEFAICSPVVLGFSFSSKSWGGFSFSRLREVEWNDKAFESLVLGEKQKSLIHGLVRQHLLNTFDDIIKNKGRGLLGLLAGTPGCGKTLTAEAVAEVARRPLYCISAGELGVEPREVEANLTRAFELAQIWDAVILLDEAEVFLQQRRPSDLQRNALVAIFLRHLEYYQGIMILTTNMVEECDAALESRIHFLVHYPELDAVARRKIWAMFAKKVSLTVTDADLDMLAAYRMNGRQIKNAVSSAQTLSLANGSQQLTLEDVNVVVGVLQDWRAAVVEARKVE